MSKATARRRVSTPEGARPIRARQPATGTGPDGYGGRTPRERTDGTASRADAAESKQGHRGVFAGLGADESPIRTITANYGKTHANSQPHDLPRTRTTPGDAPWGWGGLGSDLVTGTGLSQHDASGKRLERRERTMRAPTSVPTACRTMRNQPRAARRVGKPLLIGTEAQSTADRA